MSDELDGWLDEYKPYISTVRVCGRPDLVDEFARAERALAEAQAAAADMLSDKGVTAAKRAVEDVQDRIAASEKEFRFQGIGAQAFQDLKRTYPATEEQRKEGLDADMERWAPALIAAASIEPKVTETQARRMLQTLPITEFEKLFGAAVESNGQVIGAPKSVLAASIDVFRQNGGSSTTPLRKGSRGRSSSDGVDGPSPGTSTPTTDT